MKLKRHWKIKNKIINILHFFLFLLFYHFLWSLVWFKNCVNMYKRYNVIKLKLVPQFKKNTFTYYLFSVYVRDYFSQSYVNYVNISQLDIPYFLMDISDIRLYDAYDVRYLILYNECIRLCRAYVRKVILYEAYVRYLMIFTCFLKLFITPMMLDNNLYSSLDAIFFSLFFLGPDIFSLDWRPCSSCFIKSIIRRFN